MDYTLLVIRADGSPAGLPEPDAPSAVIPALWGSSSTPKARRCRSMLPEQ